MDSYELSLEAEQDLNAIFEYTEKTFGTEQAITYLLVFEDTFCKLTNNPLLGRERNDIRKGLRSITPNHHTVFYRILHCRIRIVRVLHSSRDLFNAKNCLLT